MDGTRVWQTTAVGAGDDQGQTAGSGLVHGHAFQRRRRGYPDDAVAFVPLYWLLNEASDRGLIFKSEPETDPDTFKWIESPRDKDGRRYDSRSGLGAYYRYGPRKFHDLCNDCSVGVSVPMPKTHESVFGRIDKRLRADRSARRLRNCDGHWR